MRLPPAWRVSYMHVRAGLVLVLACPHSSSSRVWQDSTLPCRSANAPASRGRPTYDVPDPASLSLIFLSFFLAHADPCTPTQPPQRLHASQGSRGLWRGSHRPTAPPSMQCRHPAARIDACSMPHEQLSLALDAWMDGWIGAAQTFTLTHSREILHACTLCGFGPLMLLFSFAQPAGAFSFSLSFSLPHGSSTCSHLLSPFGVDLAPVKQYHAVQALCAKRVCRRVLEPAEGQCTCHAMPACTMRMRMWALRGPASPCRRARLLAQAGAGQSRCACLCVGLQLR